MRLIYLDQNALIGLGFKAQKDPYFHKRLYSRIEDGSLRIVVSSWHLIETAQSPNIDSATRLADFMDSLKPLWIYERRQLQKLDVQEDLYRFLRVDFQVAPRVTTRSAVIAALFEQPASPKYDIPSRDFVRQWIREPEQLATLKSSIEKNIDVLQKLRELTAAGKLTEEIKKKTDEILIAASLPKTTPAGLEIGSEAKRDYLAQATVAAIPTFAVETEISAHEWGEDAVGKADRNTWIDKFHLISALPCADEIVTTDPFFHAIYPVAKQSGHVKAVVIKNDEFMDRL